MSDEDADEIPFGTNRATQRQGALQGRPIDWDDLARRDSLDIGRRKEELRRRAAGDERPPPAHRGKVDVRPQVPASPGQSIPATDGITEPESEIKPVGLDISQEADPLPPARRRTPEPSRPPVERSRPRSRPILATETTARDLRTPTPDRLEATAARVEPLILEPSAFGASPWWSSGFWRLPSEPTGRDLVCEAGTVGSLAATAVSIRGHKHRYEGVPNDDAIGVRACEAPDGTSWLVGCVCDGVGSASHASIGSAAVAKAMVEELSRLIASGAWSDPAARPLGLDTAISDVIARLDVQAGELGVSSRDLETTLTFLVVPASEVGGPRRATIGWVGDSPALILRDGRWQAVDPAAAGDPDEDGNSVASTRTNGLLTSRVLDGVEDIELQPDDMLMLCSDGIGNFIGIGANARVLGTTLAEHLARPTDVLRIVNLLSFELRSADDDRSAVIVWQLPGSVG